jgi:hypothetical protein
MKARNLWQGTKLQHSLQLNKNRAVDEIFKVTYQWQLVELVLMLVIMVFCLIYIKVLF